MGAVGSASLALRAPWRPALLKRVGSALILLPATPSLERRAIFRFAGWLPEPSPWCNVDVL